MPEAAFPGAGPGDAGFAVYVHWPFCAAKCPYCDFNSHVRHGGVDALGFADAIVAELEYNAARLAGEPARAVRSIFFGGGTPSLMPPEAVARIISTVSRLWPLEADCEITLEANPSSVEAGRFRGYRDAGVNRVSLGVQSLIDEQLRFLGRLHDRAQALAALEVAHATFPRVSFDMIYARPGQDAAAWRAELAEALSLAGEHLSLYQLTIEPDTQFARLHEAGRLVVPDADLARELYDVTQEMTAHAGLPAYEVSNHARPGAQSRHNMVYWTCGDFVGVGPGAHGRLTLSGERYATACERNPEAWLGRVNASGHGMVVDDRLARDEIADEYLLMGLRLATGIDTERFAEMAGRPLDPERIADLEAHGMVARVGNRGLRVTAEGFPVLNAVVADLAA
ncbi:MAG: coproporphyrinogen III oxidase [Rhodobiaceae bacterium]|nr:coproporphyrinogen III oxidase [Rhodobiaceae bacterium]MCC0042303.1 coproporphyrinogen III oxidase [Rhodobiaceae bacterium]